jgi:hypothetical protein
MYCETIAQFGIQLSALNQIVFVLDLMMYLTSLLANSARMATAMYAEIWAGSFWQAVLEPHFRPLRCCDKPRAATASKANAKTTNQTRNAALIHTRYFVQVVRV